MAASKPTGAFLASMRGHFPGMPEAQRCTWDSNAHLKCAPRPCANKDGGRLVMTEEDFVPEAGVICVCGACQVGDAVGGLTKRLENAMSKGLRLPLVRCCIAIATPARAR
jgi:hypothetical protein